MSHQHPPTWHYCDGEGRLDTPASAELAERHLDRRALVAGAATAIAGLWWSSPRSALAQASLSADGQNRNVLVNVFMRGGADGLNIVAPYAEDDYYRLRPSLGLASPKSRLPESQRLTDLDGFFGISPALLPLLPDFREGRLAFVHACGSADETHSHFEAMSTMEHGLANGADAGNGGWLARHLNATGSRSAPLRAVALTSTLPDSLNGAPGALAVESIAQYRLRDTTASALEDLAALYDRGGDDEVAVAGRAILDVLRTLSKVDPATYKPEHGAAYPDTPVGRAFRETAFLVKKDLGLEVACLTADSWDTHVTQGTTDGWMFGLVRDLADSIAAFRTDLGQEMSRVTVVLQTEFGRRVHENSGLGTDHGAGGVMWLFGAGVQGGKVFADWPGLVPDKLSGPGDLAVTTDYRDVMAEVLQNRLGNPDLRQVFPSLRHRPVGVVAPTA